MYNMRSNLMIFLIFSLFQQFYFFSSKQLNSIVRLAKIIAVEFDSNPKSLECMLTKLISAGGV